MYHSMIFKNSSGITKNTWDDWKLIPSAKPTFPMPEVQLKFVDIPGSNGSIDLTDYLTSSPTYNDRVGTFNFYAVDTHEDWDGRCQEIGKFLHGKNMKIILEDDPLYYYDGRVTVSDKRTDGQFPTITLSCRVRPYKIHINTGANEL